METKYITLTKKNIDTIASGYRDSIRVMDKLKLCFSLLLTMQKCKAKTAWLQL